MLNKMSRNSNSFALRHAALFVISVFSTKPQMLLGIIMINTSLSSLKIKLKYIQLLKMNDQQVFHLFMMKKLDFFHNKIKYFEDPRTAKVYFSYI